MEDIFTKQAERWEKFYEEEWQKKPTLLRGMLAKALISEDEVFSTIKRAFAEHQTSPHGFIRIFFDDMMAMMPDDFAPTIEKTLAEYEQKLSQLRPGCRFGIQINHCELFSEEIYIKTQFLLKNIYSNTSLPIHEIESVLFIGNYKSTPFGVHQDQESILSCNLIGEKRLRFWNPETPNPAPKYHNQKNIENSFILQGSIYDFYYWSGNYWHIGESDGSLTASLNICISNKKSQFNVLSDFLKNVLSNESLASTSFMIQKLAKNQVKPSDIFCEATNTPIKMLYSLPIEKILLEEFQYWMKRISAIGFSRTLPKYPSRSLLKSEIINFSPSGLALWSTMEDKISLAINGYVLELPLHPGILDLLEYISKQNPSNVGDLLKRFSNEATVNGEIISLEEEGVLAILELLWELRAFKIV
jgi:hypothetical protein